MKGMIVRLKLYSVSFNLWEQLGNSIVMTAGCYPLINPS